MAASIGAGRGEPLIKTTQGTAVIGGNHTDVLISNYVDRLFIVVTQLEKLGTLVHASLDAALEVSSGDMTYTTHVLLGKDEPMIHVLARSLASQIPVQKPILFALALKDTSTESLKAYEQLVLQHRVW